MILYHCFIGIVAVLQQHYRTDYKVSIQAGAVIKYIAENIDAHRKRFVAAKAVPILTEIMTEYDQAKLTGNDKYFKEKWDTYSSCGFARSALCNYYDPETRTDHRYEG